MTDKRFWHAAVATGLADRGCHCDPPGSGEEHCTGHCLLRDAIKRLTLDSLRLTEMWDADRESLTAEVKRLRADFHTLNGMVAMLNEQIIGLKTRAERAEAEAERLEQARDMVAEEREAWKARALEEQAEVKRLLLDNAELSHECDQWQQKVADCWREIERLRAREQP